MNNKSARKPEFTITVFIVLVAAAAAAVLVALTATTTENVFAYDTNQAKSDANSCGNGEGSINVGCQNTDSQIQGDENAVALTAQQTFPEVAVPPEPPTCEECHTNNLTPEEIETLEQTGYGGLSIAEFCELMATLPPVEQGLVIADTGEFLVNEMGVEVERAKAVVDCLFDVFGIVTGPV